MNKYKQRNESSIINIRVFHNWVKRQLINDAKKYLRDNYNINEISLLDLAVGKGGDIGKWYDAGIYTVIGFDIDETSINGKNGAIDRYNEFVSKLKPGKKIPNYKFYVMDLSDPDSISKIQHIIPGQKFNIISCQFAIHYFFKNELSLNTLVSIINNHSYQNNTKTIFISTTMNGEYLSEIFKKNIEIKNSLFRIIKSKEITMKNNSPYGNKYTVSLGKESDIGHYFVEKPSEEYMVNLEELKKVCEKKNLIFIGKTNFDRWYEMYLETKTLSDKYKLTNEEKEFSFLNYSFIFMSIKS